MQNPNVYNYAPDCCGSASELHLYRVQLVQYSRRYQLTASDKCGVLLRDVTGADYQYDTRYLGSPYRHVRPWDGNNCSLCENDAVILNGTFNPFYSVMFADPDPIPLRLDTGENPTWHSYTARPDAGLFAFYILKNVGDSNCPDSPDGCAGNGSGLGVKYENLPIPSPPIYAVARIRVAIDGDTATLSHKLFGLFRGKPLSFRQYVKSAAGVETFTTVTAPKWNTDYTVYFDEPANVKEIIRFIPLGSDSDIVPAECSLLRKDYSTEPSPTAITQTFEVAYPYARYRDSLDVANIIEDSIPTEYESASEAPTIKTDAPRMFYIYGRKIETDRVEKTDDETETSGSGSYPGPNGLDAVANAKWYEDEQTITESDSIAPDACPGDVVSLTITGESANIRLQDVGSWKLLKRERDGAKDTRFYYLISAGPVDTLPAIPDNFAADETDSEYARKVYLLFQGQYGQPCVNISADVLVSHPFRPWVANVGPSSWSNTDTTIADDTPLATYTDPGTAWWIMLHELTAISTYYGENEAKRMAKRICSRWTDQATALAAFKTATVCTLPGADTSGYYKYTATGTGQWSWQCRDGEGHTESHTSDPITCTESGECQYFPEAPADGPGNPLTGCQFPGYPCSPGYSFVEGSAVFTWTGPGTVTWSKAECDQHNTGACCLPDWSCVDGVTAAECAALGGSFKGADTSCATTECNCCRKLSR